jgi:thioredoxin reductase (NADPH)
VISVPLWSLYAIPLMLILWLHVHHRQEREARAQAILRESIETGLTDPPSLHPIVDPNLCMGSGACVEACHEGNLGIVNGKAHLINPSACIGHGYCAAACPVEALKLVFGTERRGVEIPYVKPDFETNVSGIYIAGELGGMGSIRKAAEQGRQAMESIARNRGERDQLDVVIVGVGPAGISATLAAMDGKLRFVTLEQEDSLGGTVYHYPRNKVIMTQPVALPIVGRMKLAGYSKESLLGFWQGIVDRVGMPISFKQRVEKIAAAGRGFLVKCGSREYHTRSILLAIGRRGTPRKLGVPGEELAKVVYKLVDPGQYRDKHVLVVGGGDSAIEAAVALAAERGTRVTLSYRGEAFGRVKARNRERLSAAESAGQLKVALRSTITRIDERHAILEHDGRQVMLENDNTIVCAGGVLPTPMLKEIGVLVETKFGTA